MLTSPACRRFAAPGAGRRCSTRPPNTSTSTAAHHRNAGCLLRRYPAANANCQSLDAGRGRMPVMWAQEHRPGTHFSVRCAAFSRRREQATAEAAAAMEAGWGQQVLGGLAALSTLGSVAGAVAAIVTEQMMFVYFPIALPVVALLANAQRERIRSQNLAKAMAEQLVAVEDALSEDRPMDLSQNSIEILLALGDAIKAQSDTTEGQLQKLDEKMTNITGGLKIQGRASAEAAKEATAIARWMEKMAPQIASEVVRLVEERSASNVEVVTGKLARVEASISGLEVAQDAAIRELSMGLSARLEGISNNVLDAIEAESRQRINEGMMLPPGMPAGTMQALPQQSMSSLEVELMPAERERLRMLVEEELEISLGRVLKQQAREGRLTAEMVEEQWATVAQRLARMQDTLMAVAEEQPTVVQSAIRASLGNALETSSAKPTDELKDILSQGQSVLEKAASAADDVRMVAERQQESLEQLDNLQNLLQELQTSAAKAVEARDSASPENAEALKERLAEEIKPLVSSISELRKEMEAVRFSLAEAPADSPQAGNGGSKEEGPAPGAAARPEAQASNTTDGRNGDNMKPVSQWLESESEVERQEREQEMISVDSRAGAELVEQRQSFENKGEEAASLTSKRSSSPQSMDKSASTEGSNEIRQKALEDGDQPGSSPENELRRERDEEATEMPRQETTPAFDEQQEVELMREGLEMMREGREILREGGNLLQAEDLLMAAEEAFDDVLRLNPTNIKALGNLGNALLCRGQLKIELLDSRQVSDRQGTETEAEMLLSDAGRCFQAILETTGDDPRAFRNWAVALRSQASLVATKNPAEAEDMLYAAEEKMKAADSMGSNATRTQTQ